ncbi:MAG: hypothetical protein J6K18_06225 [Bacilli bacterium]|nr:hypothetical protein [Bacilli bacterium]
MKVKVIEMFWDKYNPKTLHKVNDVLENVTDERYSEIKELVEIIENKKEEKKLEERVK